MYVGQSVNILKRIGDHMNTKDFDGYSYEEIEGNLDEYEAELIIKYNPPLNKSLPPSNRYTQINVLHSIRDGATPVWMDYYRTEDLISYSSTSSCWQDSEGSVCFGCGYGLQETWRPAFRDGFCPKCGSKYKVEWQVQR